MLYPRFSLRAVCKTFAVTAAGVAALVGPVQAAPDANWTLVDLDEAPAVVVPAAKPAANADKAGTAPAADKGREPGSSVLERAREAVRAALEKSKESAPAATPAPAAAPAPVAAPAPAPVPVAAPQATLPPAKPKMTLTRQDETVRAGVERWATANGWVVSWELTQKWPVRFEAQFGEDFLPALEAVCAHLHTQGSEVRAYLYAGNKVLRVVPASTEVVIADSDLTGSEKERADWPHLVQSKGLWLGGPAVDAKPAEIKKPVAAPAAVQETAMPAAAAPAQVVPAARAEAPKATPFESHRVAPERLPALFSASISLTFSNQATLGTVAGLLGTVTGIEISLPADVDFPVSRLYESAAPNADEAQTSTKGKKKAAKAKDNAASRTMRAYTGTPKELLDRISLVTGMLWEYQEKTVFFHE